MSNTTTHNINSTSNVGTPFRLPANVPAEREQRPMMLGEHKLSVNYYWRRNVYRVATTAKGRGIVLVRQVSDADDRWVAVQCKRVGVNNQFVTTEVATAPCATPADAFAEIAPRWTTLQ